MLRFRLFGVPYEITPFFWIGSAILGGSAASGQNGWLLLVIWVACVFVSIVAHEFGHALAARRYGLQPRVALYQFGGVTYFPGGVLSRAQHIAVSLAGPAAGFVMYLATRLVIHWLGEFQADDLLYAPTQGGLIFREVVGDLLFINGVWTLFNLLPILPLDGGQVLRDLLGPSLLGVSRVVGAVCAGALCVWAGLRGQPFLAFFLGYLAYTNLAGNPRSILGN